MGHQEPHRLLCVVKTKNIAENTSGWASRKNDFQMTLFAKSH